MGDESGRCSQSKQEGGCGKFYSPLVDGLSGFSLSKHGKCVGSRAVCAPAIHWLRNILERRITIGIG